MIGRDEPGPGDDVDGEPGEGRVLVLVDRGGPGRPRRWCWTLPSAAAHWDERHWRPFGGVS